MSFSLQLLWQNLSDHPNRTIVSEERVAVKHLTCIAPASFCRGELCSLGGDQAAMLQLSTGCVGFRRIFAEMRFGAIAQMLTGMLQRLHTAVSPPHRSFHFFQ
jgi:hypothetical protein